MPEAILRRFITHDAPWIIEMQFDERFQHPNDKTRMRTAVAGPRDQSDASPSNLIRDMGV